MIRRHVADDNSCLFNAIAYSASTNKTADTADELRKYCAEIAEKEPNFFSADMPNDLILGMDIPKYKEWITNTFHWGGENEVLILARKFKVEISIVSCESLSVMHYGNNEGFTSRICRCAFVERVCHLLTSLLPKDILYTGQHYDPMVGNPTDGPDADCMTADEMKLFPIDRDWSAAEETAIAIAKVAKEAREELKDKEHTKALKCGGCGAICADTPAFQAHCSEVEHDDDFGYECTEVIVADGKVVDKIKFNFNR
jgi:hypothetical protein